MATIFDNSNIQLTGVTLLDPLVSGPVTVTNDGIIANPGGVALALSGGNYKLRVDGLLNGGVAGLDLGVASKAHSVVIGASGEIVGNAIGIQTQSNTTFTNFGQIQGSTVGIFVGAGHSIVINAGTIVQGNVVGNAIQASLGSLQLHNFRNIDGNILGGSFRDTIGNVGTITGNIDLGDGDNLIVNKGTIDGNVTFGGGNDFFWNALHHDGAINMGAGNDSFFGGNEGESIGDELGADTYSFGGGHDTYLATTGASDGLTDTVNGGTSAGANPPGIVGDAYDASGAANALIINMNGSAQVDIFDLGLPSYVRNTASGVDIGGTDNVKGFETIQSGAGKDVVFGGNLADLIKGGDNEDHLFGLAGKDIIEGENGTDFIVGGAGADQLNGNTGVVGDGLVDTFAYTKLSDSTNAVAGRDTINVFEDGIDVIDFSRLALAGTATVAATLNATFAATGNAEVRVLEVGSGYLIQLDADGNGTSDLAINIAPNGAMTWDATDFVF